MSLEEPGARGGGDDSSAPPERNTPLKPRTMAIFMMLWLGLALFWLVPTLWFFSQGDRDYLRLAIGLCWLGLAVVYFVQWRQARTRRRSGP